MKSKVILDILREKYGKRKSALVYNKDYELVIAVILSAQCTDDRVNLVTKKLFQELPTLESFSNISIEKLEKLIFSTGFYKNKAKNIKGCVEHLLKGIPKTMKELIKIPGIGRKTANVVLSELYNISEGIVVDTHILRVSKRLKFSNKKSAESVERDLMQILAKEDWIDYGNLVILHGRESCKARKPKCDSCIIKDFCPSNGLFQK